MGVCTGWGANGNWVIEAPMGGGGGAPPVWVQTVGGNLPEGAISGGEDAGEPLYVGRASHEGALLPGKVPPSHAVCYVA